MSFLLGNWQLILIALLAAAATLFANLWQSEVKDFAEFKGAVVVLGQEAEKETKRVKEVHATALKESKDEWAKTLPGIRSTAIDNYMRRFPLGLCGNTGGSEVPGHADSPKTPDGTQRERVASDAFIAACGKDAAKLKSLREWAGKNKLPVEK